MPDPDRRLIGSIAANDRWSRATEDERRQGTEAARSKFAQLFEDQVDPDGVLDPIERARRARNARRAHMARLARLSAAVRRQKLLDRLAEQAALDIDTITEDGVA